MDETEIAALRLELEARTREFVATQLSQLARLIPVVNFRADFRLLIYADPSVSIVSRVTTIENPPITVDELMSSLVQLGMSHPAAANIRRSIYRYDKEALLLTLDEFIERYRERLKGDRWGDAAKGTMHIFRNVLESLGYDVS